MLFVILNSYLLVLPIDQTDTFNHEYVEVCQ